MSVDNIRETHIGACIGATIVDITADDAEEFLADGSNCVYLHLSNGQTIFATLGVDGESLFGTIDMDANEDDADESARA